MKTRSPNSFAQYFELVKKYKIQLGFLLFLISVGVLLVLYFSRTEGDDTDPSITRGSIDQPLPSGSIANKNINIPTDAQPKEGVIPSSLDVYDILKEDKYSRVNSLVTQLGKGNYKKESFDNMLFYWKKSESEDFYLIEYNAYNERLFFRFDEAATLSGVSQSVISSADAEKLFTTLMAQLLPGSEYINIQVTSSNREFRIEANRKVGDYPLLLPGFDQYSDYLQVDAEGRLLEASLSLLEFDKDSAVELGILSPIQLGAVISSNDYPKQFNQAVAPSEDFEGIDLEEYPVNPGDEFLGDAPTEVADFPEANSCTAKSIELVYYFDTVNYKKLTPVYRIDCQGSVLYKGKNFSVDIVIFANALDPEYVYVPPR